MNPRVGSSMGLWVLIFAAAIVGRAARADAVDVQITSPPDGAAVATSRRES